VSQNLNELLGKLVNALSDKSVLQAAAAAILAAVFLAAIRAISKSSLVRRMTVVRKARRFRRSVGWDPQPPHLVSSPQFVGRTESMDAFENFTKGTAAAMSFYGPSGRGKTAVVTECSRRVKPGTAVVYIDCKGIPSIAEFFELIIRQLGARHFPRTFRAILEQVGDSDRPKRAEYQALLADSSHELALDLSRLGRSKLLIVLDSFEQVQGSTLEAVIREQILPTVGEPTPSSRVQMLIAGWDPLDWAEDGAVRVEQHPLDEFNLSDTAMLLEEALSTRPSDEVIETIHEACAGEPIDLAVLAEFIQSDRGREAGDVIAGLDRLLGASKAESSARLVSALLARTDEDQLAWLRACALSRTFDSGVLSAALGVSSEVANKAFRDVVNRFRSIVRRRVGAWGYQVHDTARAALILDLIATDPNAFKSMSARLAAHFDSLAVSQFEPFSLRLEELYHMLAADQHRGLSLFKRLRFHVLTELRRTDLGEALQFTMHQWVTDTGLPLGRPLCDWVEYGDAGIAWRRNDILLTERICDALTRKTSLDPFLKTRILDTRGNCAWKGRQDGDEALRLYSDARRVKERLLETDLLILDREEIELSIADMTAPVARILELRGKLHEAAKQLGQAESIYLKHAPQERTSLLRTRVWLARNARKQGRWNEARGYFDQVAEIAGSIPDEAGEAEFAWVISSRAALDKEDGHWRTAEQQLSASIKKLRGTTDWERLGVALIDLGDVLRLLHRPRSAARAYREANSLLARVSNRANDAHILFGLACLALENGDRPNAHRLLAEADASAGLTGDRSKEAEIKTVRASVASTLDDARALLDSAWNLLADSECLYYKSRLLIQTSSILQASGSNRDDYQWHLRQGREWASTEPYANVLSMAALVDARLADKREPRLRAYVESALWAAAFNDLELARVVEVISGDWAKLPDGPPSRDEITRQFEHPRSSVSHHAMIDDSVVRSARSVLLALV
jgi:tetratricopeptide (TPR) repeat protein